MLKRIKNWLLERFLPMWAKETVFAENQRLKDQVKQLEESLARKEAYITGMVAGMKCQRRVIINTAEEKK